MQGRLTREMHFCFPPSVLKQYIGKDDADKISLGCGNFNVSHLFEKWQMSEFSDVSLVAAPSNKILGVCLILPCGVLGEFGVRQSPKKIEQWNGAVNEIWDSDAPGSFTSVCGVWASTGHGFVFRHWPKAFPWAGNGTCPPTVLHGGSAFA